jgi:type II secretory pathway component GspD/PulD (secretin)
MKTTTLALILFLTGLDLWAQMLPATNVVPRTRPGPTTPAAPATPPAAAPNNLAAPAPAESASTPPETPAYSYNLQGVDVNQVLDLYADLVGRTILRAGLPNASIVLHTQALLTKTEAIEALQAVLALNGISLINVGDKFVKALQSGDANSAAAPLDYSTAGHLPELGSYVTHIVQLKYVKPSEMIPTRFWRLTATASSSSATTPKT